MLIYLVLFVVAAALSAGLTKVVRDRANKMGLAFAPDSPRHIHTSPIPRVGGVAIFFTFVIISLLYFMGVSVGVIHRPHSFSLMAILIPATGLFVVGLIDDLRKLNARVKLAAQVAGGAFLYFFGFRLVCLHSLSHNLGAVLCFSLTVGTVVLVCNAINLIDGLDGLAAGAALFSMVTIFTFALANGRHGVALAVTILAAANLGFLVFNFNPASIFLGDSGSLFIGFMLSGLVMAESGQQSDALHSLLVPVIALALPLTDLGLTIARRLISGHSLFGADREHIHHKLLELGLSHRQVVTILYGVSALFAVLSLTLLHPSRLLAIPVVAILVLCVFFGVRRLNYQEFGELERFARRLRQQKQIAACNVALHKAADYLPGTRNAAAMVALLQQGLHAEFDGFRINLDQGYWISSELDDAPTRIIEKWWAAFGDDGKLLLTMDLYSARYGKIGQLHLEHSAGKRLLIDSALLQGAFRQALGQALEQFIVATAEDLVTENTRSMAHRA